MLGPEDPLVSLQTTIDEIASTIGETSLILTVRCMRAELVPMRQFVASLHAPHPDATTKPGREVACAAASTWLRAVELACLAARDG